MLVNINNAEYKIYWRYSNTGDTQCVLLRKKPETEEFEDFKFGGAWLSVKDDFNKHIGRKLSFTRVLQKAFNDRKIREIFWKAYFNMQHKEYGRK